MRRKKSLSFPSACIVLLFGLHHCGLVAASEESTEQPVDQGSHQQEDVSETESRENPFAAYRFAAEETDQEEEISAGATNLSVDLGIEENWIESQEWDSVNPIQFQEPALPSTNATSNVSLPTAAVSANREMFGVFGVDRTALPTAPRDLGIVLTSAVSVSGRESAVRSTTDAGDLAGSSPSVLNLGVQRRNPVVTDPRVRGSRVGSLAASGSYWVPARIDLDTVTSKFDSRLIEQINIIPGPYTALQGPGFGFIDLEFIKTPRYSRAPEAHGKTSVDYSTNGEQWYGRQSVMAGGQDWGLNASYGHSTGNDYSSGAGIGIPSSFKSRDAFIGFGGDLTEADSIETSYIRLDQTDVELPGQAFDLDYLVTDGFEFAYVASERYAFDQLVLETWMNRTRFEGSAQRPGKRAQFPFYDNILFNGVTDVDSLSTGYSAAFSWEGDMGDLFTAGADLRYLKQELNEIITGAIGPVVFINANSPIPRSHYSNPGLFAEFAVPVANDITLTTGGRVDWVSTDVEDDPNKLAAVGTQPQPASEKLGSSEFSQNEFLGMGFISLDRELGDGWSTGASVGYSERAPNLTERYAIESFMFVLQNGLNTVTGDPELDKERLIQFDIRLQRDAGTYRGRVNGYYAWYSDYITFETIDVFPSSGVAEQVNLKYVNTDRAVIAGVEAYGELEVTSWLIPFASLKSIYGQDQTRDGNFATSQAVPGSPSFQDPNQSRGAFSNVPGEPEEPLPSILPFESRVGVRLGPSGEDNLWGIELSARIVENQDRVAASLLETPTPGFTIWDLRTFWRATDEIQLVAGFENFTDKDYREHLDFRSQPGSNFPGAVFQPGMNFYFGTEITR